MSLGPGHRECLLTPLLPKNLSSKIPTSILLLSPSSFFFTSAGSFSRAGTRIVSSGAKRSRSVLNASANRTAPPSNNSAAPNSPSSTSTPPRASSAAANPLSSATASPTPKPLRSIRPSPPSGPPTPAASTYLLLKPQLTN